VIVRHILEKDWMLLWPLVAALAVLQGLLAFARFTAGQFVNGLPTVPGSFLELLAAAIVITLVVHQDPIPGVRQDWLVRPISRRDLFLAKLLFVVVLVQGPMFITDLLQGLANGFSFGQSGAAAIACAVSVLLTLTLPVLAFATITAGTTEMLVAALGIFAVVVSFLIVPGLVGANKPTALTGFAWVPAVMREALLLVAAAGVLVLQYRWRRTAAARALFAATLLIGQCATFLPWRIAFRLEQLLTASSGNNHGITVAFAPGEGRFRPAPGQGLDDVQEKPGMGPVDVAAENQRRRAEGALTVFFPVRVSGLIPDSRLLADRSEVTVIGRDGRSVYQGTGNDLELRATTADATLHQGIRVPGALYSRFKGELVDVHLDYSFTLFRTNAAYALAARDGDQRMPGIGWCVTKVNDAGNRVLFRCLQPGERPPCLTVVLEHAPTRQRNPEVSLCVPDYTPYPGHTFPDALSRFGGTLPFYDPSGLIRYPVGGPQLSEARVVVTAFEPTEHFVRRVVIPAVRLQDWEPQVPASTVLAGMKPER
jgi:hypothetical protein